MPDIARHSARGADHPVRVGHVADPVQRQLRLVPTQRPVDGGQPLEPAARELRHPRLAPDRPADRLRQFAVAPAARASVVRLVGLRSRLWQPACQRRQQFGQVVDIDQRACASRGHGHHAPFGRAEQVQHLAVARAVDCGRAHDGPVQRAGAHDVLRLGLAGAVCGQARLARGEAGGEDEPARSRRNRRFDEVERAAHIRLLEVGQVAAGGQPGDVDHRVRAVGQALQRRMVGQAAPDPLDIAAILRHGPGKRAHGDTAMGQHFGDRAADEAGRPGQRDEGCSFAHSITR